MYFLFEAECYAFEASQESMADEHTTAVVTESARARTYSCFFCHPFCIREVPPDLRHLESVPEKSNFE